ncbi:MAG TPA: FecR domain-containing protein [Dysgonamonadaceae bacterium]|nr:FecR domain-containing protein [Dysgonamonadaceae bacterium]
MNNKYKTILFDKYLRDEASSEEIERLLALIRNDRSMQDIFEDQLRKSDPEIDVNVQQKIFSNIRQSISSKNEVPFIQKKWKKVLQWAAILILPIVSALSVYYFIQTQQGNNHPTIVIAGYGEKAEVVLPDGSRVWINSGSKITYNDEFNRKQRPVYLEGEAYFEVTKDKERPFIVKTESMFVEALGTSFNIRSYSEDQQAFAVLIEGKIKVSASGQEQILSENQRAIFNKSTRTLTTDMVRSGDFIQWKSGNLYFDNQSFEDIARTLSRIFNVDIQFASDKLRFIRFSGTLGMSSIRNTLDILSLTSPMRYEMQGTTIKLYYRD